MSHKTKMFGAAALFVTLMVPAVAATAPAITTANVNLRAGPSTAYPAVNVVGAGQGIRVFGCLNSRSWCDVGVAGQRGWISSSYIAFVERGRRYTGVNAITAIRAPVISFSFGGYWDSHYKNRPFFRDRARWEREQLRDAKGNVREERRDVRDARQDLRQERREGDNTRVERRELRQDKRDLKDARKDLRKERRD